MTIINNNAILIETVVPELKLGEIMLSADNRSTKEKKLSDAERIRRAVLPNSVWGELSATLNGEKSQGLSDILRNALKLIANDRLRDALNENPLAREIPLSSFTVPELLRWSEETATSRGSITFTRDDATSWFATSATRAAIVQKHSSNPKLAGILAMLEARFGALAAKNHGLKSEEEANKLLAMIADSDTTGERAALVGEITGRLTHIAKQMAERAKADSVSLDDL